jgi:hypothetical protein
VLYTEDEGSVRVINRVRHAELGDGARSVERPQTCVGVQVPVQSGHVRRADDDLVVCSDVTTQLLVGKERWEELLEGLAADGADHGVYGRVYEDGAQLVDTVGDG